MGITRARLACGLVTAVLASAGLATPALAAESHFEPAELAAISAVRGESSLGATAVMSTEAVEDCLQVRMDGDLTTLRYAGVDRYETSVCASLASWDDHDAVGGDVNIAQAVVLARGDLFPDALAGGPLAAYAQAPLLLTRPGSLPAVVSDEIERVLAPGGMIYLLGGDVSISPAVENELIDAGYTIERLAGADRYETAIAIAEALPDTSNFFFVTGKNFPDALAAGTASAAITLSALADEDPGTRPMAVLLTRDEVMPQAVAEFAIARADQFDEWLIFTAGGQADAAALAAFGPANVHEQFVGADRYETAVLVADLFVGESGLVGAGVGLSTSINFPDALSASPLLALFAEPLLLTHPNSLRSAPEGFLTAHAGEALFLDIFGGDAAISTAVENAAIAAFQ